MHTPTCAASAVHGCTSWLGSQAAPSQGLGSCPAVGTVLLSPASVRFSSSLLLPPPPRPHFHSQPQVLLRGSTVVTVVSVYFLAV